MKKNYLKKTRLRLKPEQKAFDVICGMELESSSYATLHEGQVYYFCSENCKRHFDGDPEKYVGKIP